jgi:ferrous iron transport protein A
MEPVRRTLDQIAPGARCRILALEGGQARGLRLMELGFLPGSTLEVLRRAPLGCPIEVRVGLTHYAVRRDEAREILIEPLA